MNDLTPDSETPPEPSSLTGEKSSINKAREEFIGDEAVPSMDKSEWESGEGQADSPSRNKSMSDQNPAADDGSNTIKDPNTWTTGGEPATGAQMSYLKTLASETHYEFDDTQAISKADASKLIDELRQKSERVQESK